MKNVKFISLTAGVSLAMALIFSKQEGFLC